MLNNIPAELRAYPQWICWRLEWRKDDPQHVYKPTKIPYNPITGFPASVTNPNEWVRFDVATYYAPFNSVDPVDPGTPISQTGFSGLGFVFSNNDPYSGIDLDDSHGDKAIYADQLKIFNSFDSYSELSPSGKGLHIIIVGKIAGRGRRRSDIALEIYSRERYFTFTGNVYADKPIAERQTLLNTLYSEMGKGSEIEVKAVDQPERHTDERVLDIASRAANGSKFVDLYRGNWQQHYRAADGTGDQSRADFALVDMLGYWTQNKAQIRRLFLASQLGQRDKARNRIHGYVDFMITRSFDRQLPPIDIDTFAAKFHAQVEEQRRLNALAAGNGTGAPAASAAAALGAHGPASAPSGDNQASHAPGASSTPFPPGLLGDIAQFIYQAAPRPVHEIALAGAIACMCGIAGRAYNINHAGLNQYIILLARTGIGKEAIADGIAKLMTEVIMKVPGAKSFRGPGVLASSPGLIKWLRENPCCLSVLGELGKKLKAMSHKHAPPHLEELSGTLLGCYSKSGAGKTLDPSAYSDKDKNGDVVHSPAYSIIGESTPELFYKAMDENLVQDGLLPRFMLFDYKGKRGYMADNFATVEPSIDLVEKVATLSAHCLSISGAGKVIDVRMTDEAKELSKQFDRWTTDSINDTSGNNISVTTELWNRAHLKALKLAALAALGINYINPIVDRACFMWASKLVVDQTRALLKKFETGEVGEGTNEEAVQIKEVCRIVGLYGLLGYDAIKNYNAGTPDMHRDGVIMFDHISRRLGATAVFRNDRLGARFGLKRAVEHLIESGDLAEIPRLTMFEKYGKNCRAFVVTDPTKFAEAVVNKA